MGIEVRVRPTKELFFNDENHFGIYSAEVHPDDMSKVKINRYYNISFKGVVPKLELGAEYIAKIKEDSGSKYEGSYILESIHQDKPTTISEQKKFFEMLLTEKQVENIFAIYDGQDVIAMIQDGSFDYEKVKGIGHKTFEKMREKVLNNLDMSELLVFLAKHDIKYNMVSKLVKEYGNPQIVIDKISTNPYILTELKGVGFKKADAIAKAMKYDMKSPNRIEACIKYCIAEENANGHSWVNSKQLINKAIDFLSINKSYIEEVLDIGIKDVINVDDRYTLKSVYDSEKYVAMRMIQIKTQSKNIFVKEEFENMINDYCEKNNVELEENQRKFLHDWNENSILMLVGGGGMGKSWLQRILLEFIKKKNYRTALLAPTGKAAKVMTGYTGISASTIHRKAGVFENGEDGIGEIYEDIIIIDESSMCDIFILAKFFKALKNDNARILFVGDDFQLPSVGVGNFLYDVINSNTIKVSILKKVFRQADGGILNVSTDVRENNKFLNIGASGRTVFGKDCVFWLVDQEYIKDGVISNYKKLIKNGYSPDDIAILTPTNKGKLGTISLNKEIQKLANPQSASKKEKMVGKKDDPIVFRVGDNVMNLVNTYGIETADGGVADIFNGDTGTIVDINDEDKVFIVEIDGIFIKMKFSIILSNLVHSWVTTIHKSQGSQYSVVIAIADKSMTYQLNANLLYTGFSRAKKYMLVLTQAQTVNKSMDKFANMERRSFLQELLHQYNAERDAVKSIDDEQSMI